MIDDALMCMLLFARYLLDVIVGGPEEDNIKAPNVHHQI